MVVQTFVTSVFLFLFFAQVVIVLILVHWPLKFVMNCEWMLLATAFVCCVTVGTILFLAVSIFEEQYWHTD